MTLREELTTRLCSIFPSCVGILIVLGALAWLWFCGWLVQRLRYESPVPVVLLFFAPAVLWALYTVATHG